MASSSRSTLDEPSTDAHQELLIEHFGFHPRVFVDALVYAANEHLYSIGGQFEEFAKRQLKSSSRKAIKREKERAATGSHAVSSKRGAGQLTSSSTAILARMTSTQLEAEAERGVHGVLTLLENALDHIFDLLELYCLRTVFGVKPSQAKAITLEHHRGLDLRSAAERAVTGDVLSAEEESRELAAKEEALRAELNRARGIQHALHIANLTAEQSLARARRVSKAFGALAGDVEESEPPPLHAAIPQSARKLKFDALDLMESLERLTQADPLGASLIVNAFQPSETTSDKERRDVLEASGATDSERRSWEGGREAYINWEMDRIIQSVKTRASDRGAADRSVSMLPFFSTPSKDQSRRPSSHGIAKRRRTTRTSNVHLDESGHQAAQIGEPAEVETLADLVAP